MLADLVHDLLFGVGHDGEVVCHSFELDVSMQLPGLYLQRDDARSLECVTVEATMSHAQNAGDESSRESAVAFAAAAICQDEYAELGNDREGTVLQKMHE